MLERLAQDQRYRSTAEDQARLDRKRKGKKLSNHLLGFQERPRGQDRQDEGWHVLVL